MQKIDCCLPAWLQREMKPLLLLLFLVYTFIFSGFVFHSLCRPVDLPSGSWWRWVSLLFWFSNFRRLDRGRRRPGESREIAFTKNGFLFLFLSIFALAVLLLYIDERVFSGLIFLPSSENSDSIFDFLASVLQNKSAKSGSMQLVVSVSSSLFLVATT